MLGCARGDAAARADAADAAVPTHPPRPATRRRRPGARAPPRLTGGDDAQRRFFERAAGRYDARFLRERWPRNQEVKARFVDAALGLEDGLVVELGCGTGQIAAALLRRRPRLRYVGADLSPSMLALARRRLRAFGERVRLEEARATRLPVESQAADAAFGVDVLHHVEDPAAALAELRRALKPGAPAVFLEGNPLFPVTALIGVLQREERGLLRLRPRTLRAWFEHAGFVDVRVDLAPLFTPPGPPPLVPLFDRLDRVLPRVPAARHLALFLRAYGRAGRGATH